MAAEEKGKKVNVLVRFHYEETPTYDEYYIHGALGSVNQDYDFQMKFYRQSQDPLETERVKELIKSGEDPDPEMRVIREFQFGVNMSLKTMKETGIFLMNQIKIFEDENGNIPGTQVIEDND